MLIVSGSQLGAMLPTSRGEGGLATDTYWVSARFTIGHPTMHETAPNKNCPVQNVRSAEVEMLLQVDKCVCSRG